MESNLGTVANSEAPAIQTGRAFSLEQVISMQAEFKRTAQYTPLGRIMTIILMMRDGEKCPPPDTDVWGRSIELERRGPMLALSRDQMHLICVGNFPLVLPDTVDPRDTSQRLKQRYADRSDKHLRGTNYVIFEPIYQLLADPLGVELPGANVARPPLVIDFKADSFGNEPALLIDSENGEGYIANGAFDLHA